MPKKGNPQIHLRLSPDHWIWKIDSSEKRNEEIRKALEFYHRFGNFLQEFRETKSQINKINDILLELKDNNFNLRSDKIITLKEEQQNETKDKLFDNMDKFLNF